jgi:hypothetical protein
MTQHTANLTDGAADLEESLSKVLLTMRYLKHSWWEESFDQEHLRATSSLSLCLGLLFGPVCVILSGLDGVIPARL